jgi:hypothetical protein
MWQIEDHGDYLEVAVNDPRIDRLDAFFAEIEASPGFRPGKPLLAVHRTGRFRASHDQLRRLGMIMRRHLERLQTRLAVVVPEDLEYGEVRVVDAVMGSSESLFLPFRDKASALEWLLPHQL